MPRAKKAYKYMVEYMSEGASSRPNDNVPKVKRHYTKKSAEAEFRHREQLGAKPVMRAL